MDTSSLLTFSEMFLDKAKRAYEISDFHGCAKSLGELYDFLNDQVGAGSFEECESNESSDGS